jgi:hypothetical protein
VILVQRERRRRVILVRQDDTPCSFDGITVDTPFSFDEITVDAPFSFDENVANEIFSFCAHAVDE